MMGEEGRKEAMESLSLDDDEDDNKSTSKSYSNYRSAMTSLSDSHHPLSPSVVATPADSDPLLAPPETSSIQPPSPYADIVSNPLDASIVEELNGIQNPNDDSSNSTMPEIPPSLNLEYLNITVSDPHKEMESGSIVPGSNTYVTYLITTKTNLPDYVGSDFSVRRRFKDVVTLSDRLSEGYRGYFIPPRPDKSVVESQVMQKQEFVEQRRSALEKYLQKLASHPVIKKSDELRVFLQVDGKLPLPTTTDVASRVLDGAVKLPKQLFGGGSGGNVIGPQDVVQPAKGGRDLLRLFKELKQSVANDWGGSKSLVEEEDKDFLEKKEGLQNLELQLSNASKQAELLVKAQQDMGETIGELGLTFIKLTKFENERATLNSQRERAADMKNVATAAVKASRLYRELNSQTVKHLDILHEHLSLMLGIHHAFSDRSSALLTVQTLISELSSLNSKAEKLETTTSKIFGGDKSRVRKSEELKDAIRVTEDAKSCAIREYERIKESNRSEIDRINRERHVDFVKMLKGFITNQVAYTERIGQEWSKVAEETSRYSRENA
ncbi:sorting nexin 2B isoform X2 [Nicotiana tabacum]|uniref:Sorting nexin 2B isoform X2 n=3 Tax=Nicotiana TaxID=4085 RepID=A0A1S3ZGH6_TOBAC|nr:PREDICTED: sorting nexin 2B-like isoform X2 [Nicotiana sylvestris]XP_009790714.1 PREDICTED: sorting nexin 2B-like isoform X2 [Nicotiana sylvestris]XP_009790715.1 PREDICTED: sorting nexin 2B-like isoform X2 [Nicotiana sylvestris]XP_009790716.1 PREDICTED: sorting nexin 2B-like isoform X2 [Nicotiana sylvestris]XP_016463550.1 PREDICTED: sorting nexin 2B-like isoform X2 [Nicotiana tabacum]XP_016463551.1 PREDICTED: sorting nexin 2B-like isoform X2 [Nicotiana tabacum]XP_016463552.1 PREDICTED: sor